MKIHAFTDDILGHKDATSIALAIQNKDVSEKEVLEATISRIKAVNPTLHAIQAECFEQALEEAETPSKTKTGGFFSGVPTLIKDNADLKGLPSQHGTGAFQAKAAKKSSPYVEQMLSTGLRAIGKSTMPEFGFICSTENPKWGITRNPWDTQHTPAGSSSGAAALVAAGALSIAHANDGAGSTRIPASCCGLVGLKPSRGRLLPHDGTRFLPINIVYEGVLTRSVRDTAAFYAEAEGFYKSKRLPALGMVKTPQKERLHIKRIENVPKGTVGHMDPEVFSVQEETAALLESLGHSVEVLPFPIDLEAIKELYLEYYGFLAFLTLRFSKRLFGTKLTRDMLEPFTNGLIERFLAKKFSLFQTVKRIKREIAALETELMSGTDLLMLPVTTLPCPKIGYFSPDIPMEEILQRAGDYAPFPGMQNVSGAPSISLPLGKDARNLPIGVQFAGGLGEEAKLLAFAYELEEAKPWPLIDSPAT